MNKTSLMSLTAVVFSLVISLAATVHAAPPEAFKVVPIPKREHGYHNFKSMVIGSQQGLDAFLKSVAQGAAMGWNDGAGVTKALKQAKLDFNQQELVLLRHTEGSGSVQVKFEKPQLKKGTLICKINRKEPEIGTADMAYYCFAVAVTKKDVKSVELHVPGKKPVVIAIGEEQAEDK